MPEFIKYIAKRIKWKGQKLLRALKWPKRALREFRRLYREMGPKGVFWYMAVQGRWHYGLTLVLCLFSAALMFASLLGLTRAENKIINLLLVLPVTPIVGFLHYALWQRTRHVYDKQLVYMTRLYLAPVLLLAGISALVVTLKIIMALLSEQI